MSEPRHEWPMPDYSVPEPHYLHALGVISLNYNSYEHLLFAIFSHHLKVAKVPGQFAEFVFNEFAMQTKTEAIKQSFNSFENDQNVREAVEHLLLHFNWCFEARNTLLHAHSPADPADLFLEVIPERIVESVPDNNKLPLAKPAKGSLTKLNFMFLSIEHLRAIADHMHAGYTYLLNLWVFLQVRDGQVPSAFSPLRHLMPRTLPQKPPIPRKIKLQENPEAPGTE